MSLPDELAEERAAIMEFDGTLPRKEAEEKALAEWRERQEREK